MASKKILFLCGHYASPSAANSICVQNLAEEAICQGYYAFVIARGCEYRDTYEEINGVKVWKYYGDSYGRVVAYFENKKTFFLRLIFALIQFIRYLLIFWVYPITSPRDISLLYKKSKIIIEEHNIDTIVATYGPYEAVQVALKLKKDFDSRLKVVSYHLDLLTNPSNKSTIISKLKQYQSQKKIKKEFQIVDKVLLPMTAPHFNSPKIEYVDFPLYLPPKYSGDSKISFFPTDTINIAIAGSLDSNNRNPLSFCKIVEKLPLINKKRVVLNIWGRVVGIDFNSFQNVIYHGMAKVEDVPSILQQSDFLLNVGNKNSYRMLPSKIFQMFAVKKPIIFLYSSSEDRSIPYFRKYGCTLFIHEMEQKCNLEVNDVANFMQRHYNQTVTIDDKLFEKSTPSYILHKILLT